MVQGCEGVRTASTHASGAPSAGSSGIAASASAATCSALCRPHKHGRNTHTLAANSLPGPSRAPGCACWQLCHILSCRDRTHEEHVLKMKSFRQAAQGVGSLSHRTLGHTFVVFPSIDGTQFVYTNDHQLDSQPCTKAMLTFPMSSGRGSAEGLVPAALLLGSSSALPLPATKAG